MFNFFKKPSPPQTLTEAYQAMREEVMQKTGYYLAESHVLQDKKTGNKFSLTAVVLDNDNPLEFNPTFLPASAQYTSIVFNEKVLGTLKTSDLVYLTGAQSVHHPVAGFGEIEHYQLDHDLQKACDLKTLAAHFTTER